MAPGAGIPVSLQTAAVLGYRRSDAQRWIELGLPGRYPKRGRLGI